MATNGATPQADVRESTLNGAALDFECGLERMLAKWTKDAEILGSTPTRVRRMLEEMTAGYKMDPGTILGTQFPCQSDELVILRDIDFTSLCEHHLMPFVGRAHIGYLPDGAVVGISKL